MALAVGPEFLLANKPRLLNTLAHHYLKYPSSRGEGVIQGIGFDTRSAFLSFSIFIHIKK